MTSNPMMNERVYEGIISTDKPMTISGTVNKTMGLLAIVVLVSAYTWHLVTTGFPDKLNLLMWTGAIAAFVMAVIAAFKPQYSKPLSIAYAAFKGLFLGGISAVFNAMYPGIVVQAVAGTFISMFVMLLLFKARLIRATERFKSTVLTATLSIALFYGLAVILGLFHINGPLQLISSSGLLGIGLSVFVIIIACLNFILDFDYIETGAQRMAPKYLEWYGALSLLITLIWLYLEILRLLAKLNRR